MILELANYCHCEGFSPWQSIDNKLFSTCLTFYIEYSSLLRYLSPQSGRIATINLSLFSSLLESSIAAQIFAPPENPARIPSFCDKFLAVSIASSFFTGIISSITSGA